LKDEITYIEPQYLKTKKQYENAVTPLTKKEDDDLDYDVKTSKKINVPLFISQYSNIVLDGHHRRTKALKYEITKVPCIIKYFDSQLEEFAFVCKINLLRRNMNEAQRIFNSQELFKIETKLATLRQQKGTLASSNAKGKTSHIVAKIIGVSPAIYEKGQAIIKSGDKKLIDSWIAGKRTSTAYGEVQFHQTLKRSPPLPKGIWNVIVIDLPIEYDNKTGGSMTSGSKQKYPTITWEQAFRKN